ncbi:MAG: hypothetical protein R2712_21725 [Vicinamibacterales bacterium]
MTGWAAWPTLGSLTDGCAVGIVKGHTFIEARAAAPGQKPDALLPKLEDAMKAVASRSP